MNRIEAIKFIEETFENPFDKDRFAIFTQKLLKNIKPFLHSGNLTKDSFREFISKMERIGKFSDGKNEIDILIVNLKKESSIYRARSAQRNCIAQYLNGSWGGKLKDAALVAFVSPNEDDWRFSLVKMEYRLEKSDSGKIKVKEEFTPAKRWSFLVGKNEKSHTAKSRFLPFIEDEYYSPTLEDLENAFNTEIVTDEFFIKYRDLFIRTKLQLDRILENDKKLKKDFESKNINTVDFTKKFLGQIVFLYFLQKKGWFGVKKGKEWGSGPKDFLRRLFNKEFCDYNNFFNDILEPLFYEALRTDRSPDDHYYSRFNCKIPFLNGGLFDPINNYDWVNTEIVIPNDLFSNQNKTKEGDSGDGIFDVFDRYNFTVNEEEPLDKEVALDPELLGKIYEKLNAIRQDNFDEYLRVIKSGKKDEEMKFNKEYGVYYTPREIVNYMCQESLIYYLHSEINEKLKNEGEKPLTQQKITGEKEPAQLKFQIKDEVIKKDEIEKFVKEAPFVLENEERVFKKGKETKDYYYKIPFIIRENAELIDKLLSNIKICDPAVGSGAFPIGMMHLIVNLRKLLSVYMNRKIKDYDLKRECIENTLYGVDIDLGAVEICKLRFWLSMIVDEEDFYNIKPLPNLDYKVVCGDSLLGFPENWGSQIEKEIENLKEKFFSESNPLQKQNIKKQIDEKIKWRLEQSEKNFGYKINFDFRLFFSEVFREKGGFDIVIANPPYVSTKGVKEVYKKQLIKCYDFADDTYNHFYFKGLEIAKTSGFLTYISSKTFWTIQTKKNLRELFLKNKILQLFDTANPFDSPIVDTCLAMVQKNKPDHNQKIIILDGRKDLLKPKYYNILQETYNSAPNKVFFIPTPLNMKIYEKLAKTVNDLLNNWWDKISTSKNIEKNKKILEEYRKKLKPGDITLLGLITEGGQGLATANNGKYIGVLEGTKWAENVRKQRPEKLLEATAFCHKIGIKSKQDAQEFLDKLSEKEIRKLFDDLKEKYGRDIFGQGWLYRIVSKEEIADVETLTEDEKLNGIKGKKTFVPYDKGDKEGNRWYAPTPYYIDWSRENVRFLKENSGKKGEGMPVVRNPQFYFREGFCWKDIGMDILKVKYKEKTINDVKSMSLYPIKKNFLKYLISLLNSTFMSHYQFNFINNTVSIQINNIRQLPIIIPNNEQLKQFEAIFNRAYNIKKQKFAGKLSEKEAEEKLAEVQRELDEMVEDMYMG